MVGPFSVLPGALGAPAWSPKGSQTAQMKSETPHVVSYRAHGGGWLLSPVYLDLPWFGLDSPDWGEDLERPLSPVYLD